MDLAKRAKEVKNMIFLNLSILLPIKKLNRKNGNIVQNFNSKQICLEKKEKNWGSLFQINLPISLFIHNVILISNAILEIFF